MPEVASHVEAGVVDQHVEAAVALLRGPEHGGHVLAQRYVGRDRRGCEAGRRHLGDGGLGTGAVHIGEVNVGAFLREQLRRGAAYAGGGPRDQGDASLKPSHRSPSSQAAAFSAAADAALAPSRAWSRVPRRWTGAAPLWRRSRPWWRPS